jgi:hypothetical protein
MINILNLKNSIFIIYLIYNKYMECVVFRNPNDILKEEYIWNENDNSIIKFIDFCKKIDETEQEYFDRINKLNYDYVKNKIIMCGLKTYKYTKIQTLNKNIILFNELDSSHMWELALCKNEQIQGYIHNFILNYSLFKKINVSEGKFHYAFYTTNSHKQLYKHEFDVSNIDTKKLVPIFFQKYRATWTQIHYRNTKNKILEQLNNREIDVLALWRNGHADFSPYTIHRTKLFEKIENFKKKHPQFNIIIGSRPVEEYLELLRNSKIFISPYGIGEFSIKDWETFDSETLLIKPDTDFVNTHQNMYVSGETYVKFNPDGSDFEDVILDCLENYNQYKHIIVNAKMKILKNTKEDNLKKLNSMLEFYDFTDNNRNIVNVNIYDELNLIEKYDLFEKEKEQYLEFKIKNNCDKKLLDLYDIKKPNAYLNSTGIHLMFNNYLWKHTDSTQINISFKAKAENDITINKHLKIYDGEKYIQLENTLKKKYKKFNIKLILKDSNLFIVKNRVAFKENILGLHVTFKNIKIDDFDQLK